MTSVGWVVVGLASGFVALALYGKYRTIKADFEEQREEEARRASEEFPGRDDAGPPA
jgi:hypothetical protein